MVRVVKAVAMVRVRVGKDITDLMGLTVRAARDLTVRVGRDMAVRVARDTRVVKASDTTTEEITENMGIIML